MNLSNYLDPRLVVFTETTSQSDAIDELVNLLAQEERLLDRDAFHHAILEREKIISTGIGIGVAIPHAKLPGYEDFFIAIAIQKNEGIDWQSIDDLPVRFVFMIGGPEDRQTEYLNILSMITTAIKSEERRKELLKAKTPEEVIVLFEGE